MSVTKGMKENQAKRQRAIDIANYILETKSTVREAAKKFGITKSTVHKDVAERLAMIDPELFEKVRKHLDYHLDVRHIRGGEATKALYSNTLKEKENKKRKNKAAS